MLRTFVPATIAVPIVIHGLMPHLHRARLRLLARAGRAVIVRAVSASIDRVRAALAAAGLDVRLERFDAGTRTAADAAAAIGVSEGQIVKSMVFAAPSGEPVLALASGTNRVDEDRLGALLGHPVSRPSGAQVRELTGFAIGGVPPLGHSPQPATILDEDLWRYAEIWAAAGTPRDVFATTPDDLLRATGGTRAAIATTDP